MVVVETVPSGGYGGAWGGMGMSVASVALAGDMVVVMVEDMAGRAAEAYCMIGTRDRYQDRFRNPCKCYTGSVCQDVELASSPIAYMCAY